MIPCAEMTNVETKKSASETGAAMLLLDGRSTTTITRRLVTAGLAPVMTVTQLDGDSTI